MFLPGFACPPGAYRSFLAPVADRVGKVIVPKVAPLPAQFASRSSPNEEASRVVQDLDRLCASGMQVWLGGHSRGGLVAWHAASAAQVEGLVLVDPVAGDGPPWRPPQPPPPIELDGAVAVIGFGVGGRCAPEGRNHEVFAAAMPAATHTVIPGCGHGDILDGAVGWLGRLTCGHGPDREAAADAARQVLLAALEVTGALG